MTEPTQSNRMMYALIAFVVAAMLLGGLTLISGVLQDEMGPIESAVPGSMP